MSQIYAKDSFDRFGDDLAEVLLSCLPLDLKISSECVSRQWRRLVFRRHHRFHLLRHELKSQKWSQLFIRSYVHQMQTFDLNLEILQSLLQKWTQLTELSIDTNCLCDEGLLEVLCRLHEDDCLSRLKRLDLRVKEDVDEEVLRRFSGLFGQSLSHICISGLSEERLSRVLSFFGHNLRSIDLKHNLRSLLMACEESQKKVFLNKLDTISVINPSTDDLQLMSAIYGPQVRQLSLSFDQHFKHSIKDTLKFVANLENLEILRLDSELFYVKQNDFNEHNNHYLIDSSLEAIGHKCRRLHTLEVCIFGDLISDHFLRIFGRHFERLSRLDLSLWDIGDKSFQTVDSFGFSAQNGQHLHRLSLMFEALCDDHLEEIHEFMPNLSAIKLNSDQHLTDRCLRHLSKLPHLRTIVLEGNIDMNYLTIDGVIEFIASCPSITAIDIEFANDLNEISYDVWEVLALLRPQINFFISFHDSEDRYRDVCVYVNNKNNLHVYKI